MEFRRCFTGRDFILESLATRLKSYPGASYCLSYKYSQSAKQKYIAPSAIFTEQMKIGRIFDYMVEGFFPLRYFNTIFFTPKYVIGVIIRANINPPVIKAAAKSVPIFIKAS